jgi:putative membrane protein
MKTLGACLVVACLAAPAVAQMGNPASPHAMASTSLTAFAKEAAIGGMSEVELGRLAVEKGTDPAVKQFGQHMVDDHSKANAELKTIAAQAGVQLPAEVDAKQKKIFAKLSSLSGAAFDHAYIDDMVKDHQEDIALFEKAAASAGDSPIKQFAADKLPTLREHLKMAQQAQAALGKKSPASGGR